MKEMLQKLREASVAAILQADDITALENLLHEKGELVNSMYIRKADFLKEDLHAYDNDIGYGDI